MCEVGGGGGRVKWVGCMCAYIEGWKFGSVCVRACALVCVCVSVCEHVCLSLSFPLYSFCLRVGERRTRVFAFRAPLSINPCTRMPVIVGMCAPIFKHVCMEDRVQESHCVHVVRNFVLYFFA